MSDLKNWELTGPKLFHIGPMFLPRLTSILKQHGVDFHFDDIPDTSPQSLKHYLKFTHNSKSGPNSIPYAAYKVIGSLAHSIFSVTSQIVQAGGHFRYGFSDCEAMFPPKVHKPLDHQEVIRTPSETHPLKFKSHDNNILAGEMNYALAKNIRDYASNIQNGSIKGRSFLCNVVRIDAFARFASFPEHWQFLPLIILFDLMNAFPRVAHQ